MRKRLLSRDYDKLVSEAFKILESDFFNYYSNVIDEHYNSNKDIIQGLTNAVNRLADWYRNQVDYSPVWEVDEKGIRTQLDPEKTFTSLFYKFGIKKQINILYFEKQLEILNTFSGNIELKKSILDVENTLPEPIKQQIKEVPFPDGFDFEDLKERLELLKTISESHNKNELIERNSLVQKLKYQKIEQDKAFLNHQIDELKKLRELESKVELKSKDELKKLSELEINGSIENIKNDMIKLLTKKNPKNGRIYMSETEIQHFISQNFAASSGVKEIKTFHPNMNKSELRHVIWVIYNKYHLSKQKPLWHDMFNKNFPAFEVKDISNIKDYSLDYLKL